MTILDVILTPAERIAEHTGNDAYLSPVFPDVVDDVPDVWSWVPALLVVAVTLAIWIGVGLIIWKVAQ